MICLVCLSRWLRVVRADTGVCPYRVLFSTLQSMSPDQREHCSRPNRVLLKTKESTALDPTEYCSIYLQSNALYGTEQCSLWYRALFFLA